MSPRLEIVFRSLLFVVLVSACSAPEVAVPREVAPHPVETWGSMRRVLREGHTEGRVTLEEVVRPETVAVGAMEGLAGEITVDGGAIHLASVVDAHAPGGIAVRGAGPGERATLLVAADVPAWRAYELHPGLDMDALESTVRELAAKEGIDAALPFPFRVEGTARSLRLHVIDGVCPIAHPEGPPPWRFEGEDEEVVLVGFHAEDSAGRLTHHGRASHTHAIARGGEVSGHVDEVTLAEGARLFLPATGP